jgi:hypothetical protein
MGAAPSAPLVQYEVRLLEASTRFVLCVPKPSSLPLQVGDRVIYTQFGMRLNATITHCMGGNVYCLKQVSITIYRCIYSSAACDVSAHTCRTTVSLIAVRTPSISCW